MRQVILVTEVFFVAVFMLGASCGASDVDKDTENNLPLDCSGISCRKPPPNTCATDNTLQVFAPVGHCSDGECIYDSWQEQCNSGLCEEGECVKTPCQGMTCIDPPAPVCLDANRTIYAPSGYCSGGECSYASRTSACDFTCESGSCTDSPCAEVYCRKPPAPYCQDDKNLVVFEPEGRCTVVEDQPKCLHESQTITCDHGCKDGRCQDDPCVGVVCDHPQARYCDGAELVLFEPYGVCDETGFCQYSEDRHACIEPCMDARCGEDKACDNVICNEPPASYCLDASQLRVYARDGWCEDRFCSYIYSDIDCGDKGCEEGRCKNDPCLGMACDTPPAAYCDGEVSIEFEQKGTCNDGICSYQKTTTSCQDGCENGSCVNVDSSLDNSQISAVAQDFTNWTVEDKF